MEESSAEHDGQKWGMFLENKIQQLRKERKITQSELADAVEVTRQTIISLENGRYNASLIQIGRAYV